MTDTDIQLCEDKTGDACSKRHRSIGAAPPYCDQRPGVPGVLEPPEARTSTLKKLKPGHQVSAVTRGTGEESRTEALSSRRSEKRNFNFARVGEVLLF